MEPGSLSRSARDTGIPLALHVMTHVMTHVIRTPDVLMSPAVLRRCRMFRAIPVACTATDQYCTVLPGAGSGILVRQHASRGQTYSLQQCRPFPARRPASRSLRPRRCCGTASSGMYGPYQSTIMRVFQYGRRTSITAPLGPHSRTFPACDTRACRPAAVQHAGHGGLILLCIN